MQALLRRVFVILLLLGSTVSLSWGQGIRMQADPDSFLIDLTNYLRVNRTSTNVSAVDSFSTAFLGYEPANQKKAITLVRLMAVRRANPQTITVTLNALTSAHLAGVSQEQTAQILFIAWRTYLYRPDRFPLVMGRIELFCREKALVFNKKYKVLVEAPQFNFGMAGGESTADTGAFANMQSAQPSLASSFDAATSAATDGVNTIPEPNSLPPIDGPFISLPTVDLQIITAFDSASVAKTSGYYQLLPGVWQGKGGDINWAQAGLPIDGDGPKATLDLWQWEVSTPQFTSEFATLNYPKHISKAVKGVFEWGTNRHAPEGARARYPKFVSYLGKMPWTGLPEGILLTGGMKLEGTRKFVQDFFDSKASFVFKEGGKSAFRSSSTSYEVADSNISTGYAKLVIYNQKDSIIHQGLSINYLVTARELRAETNTALFKEAAFIDSYHQMEITCDEIRYHLDSGKVEFRIQHAGHVVPAVFQSFGYYNQDMLSGIRGFKKYDPLIAILRHQHQTKDNSFTIEEVAESQKIPVVELEQSVRVMASLNFLFYDPSKRRMSPAPKMRHFYDSRLKRKDFDYMSMPSYSASGINAVFNVRTSEMQIGGVGKFYLSDSLGVYIEPDSGNVTLLKNRDIKFNGKINAGAFLTAGKNFEFSYSKFAVTLTSIDSISLNVNDKNRKDSGDLAARLAQFRKNINNNVKLEQKRHEDSSGKSTTKGILYINKPENKAGLKQYKQYPILDVSDMAYVYFDREAVAGKAYNEKVFFDVPPFNVDSANTTDPRVLNFAGKFHSDGIFPTFKERLSVQADKSLGFVHKAPKEGYQLYKGTGKFFGTVTLNSKGIRGKGEIRYLGTVIKSANFRFYQDSVVAEGKAFVMKSGERDKVSFPDVKAQAYRMRWLPKADSMIITSRKNDLQLYQGTTQLQGSLVVQTTGVGGMGTVKRQGSEITSEQLSFKEKEFSGREAKFVVLSQDTAKPAVRSTNVKFDYDLTKKIAQINPEVEGEAANEFPLLSYKTSIAKLIWDSDKKLITMSKPAEDDISSSYFYSTKQGQDSLAFQGTDATYDIATSLLTVKGVPSFTVSDARITPDSGTIVVEADAKMRTLKNASVVLDTLNEYHNLKGANIEVLGRYAFTGTAQYRYGTPSGDTLSIDLTRFQQNYPRKRGNLDKTKGVTEGIGAVMEDKPIPIAPGVVFKGNVKMVGSKKDLEFQGMIALNTKMSVGRTWIPYENLDGKPFSVDLKGAVDAASGRPIVNGLILPIQAAPGVSVYNSFVGAKRDLADIELFTAGGQLAFDAETRLFRIGSKDRLEGKSLEGNLMTYSDSANLVTYEGKFDLLSLYNDKKAFQVQTAGFAKGRTDSNNVQLSLMSFVKIDMPSAAFKALETGVSTYVKDGGLPEPELPERQDLLSRIANLSNDRLAKTYDKATAQQFAPINKTVADFATGILLNQLDMKWDKQYQSFHSTGRIGIASIGKTEINAAPVGALEIKKTANGDVVNLYLQFGEDLWYYFNLNENLRMSALSSDDAFNNAIAAKAQSPRVNRYSFGPAEEADRQNFLAEYFSKYLGISYKEGMAWPGTEQPAGDSEAFPMPVKRKEPRKNMDTAGQVAPVAPQLETDNPSTEKKPTKIADKKPEKPVEEAAPVEEAKPEPDKPAIKDPFADSGSEAATDSSKVDKPLTKKERKELERRQKEAEKRAADSLQKLESLVPMDSNQIAPAKTVINKDSIKAAEKAAAKAAKDEAKRLKDEEAARLKAEKEAAKAAEKAAKEAAKEEERKRKADEKEAKRLAKEQEQKAKQEALQNEVAPADSSAPPPVMPVPTDSTKQGQ